MLEQGSAQSSTATLHSVQSQFFAPPSEFGGCFTTFYHAQLNAPEGLEVTDYLQPEWANIRFMCGDTPKAEIGSTSVEGARFVATGPSSLPCKFAIGQSVLWGIGFLPLGWARFIDNDARPLANLVCDGEAHPAFAKFAQLIPALCEPGMSISEQFQVIVACMRDLDRPNRDEPKIMRVHKALVTGEHVTVSQLASASGMSVRSLERLCERYFGFTPKLLMRRQRFMRSLTQFMLKGGGGNWTGAMDDHYYDQAQFSREFAEFMTMNPSEYAALDHPILSSFMEARAKVWGSAAQTLDKPSG